MIVYDVPEELSKDAVQECVRSQNDLGEDDFEVRFSLWAKDDKKHCTGCAE